MSKDAKIRWGWLKGMYIFTLIHAGGTGLGIILAQNTVRSIFNWPNQDPIVLGICGSIWFTAGIIAIFGLRAPLKFSPLLFIQLIYKSVWFIGVILPIIISGNFQAYAIGYVVFFAIYIIGDLIAIPFSYIFAPDCNTVAN